MTSNTIATLPRVSREWLACTIRGSSHIPLSDAKTVVVDVRDSDHIGGHIRGSIHASTPTLDYRMPELVRQLKDKDNVVFHCALSQQRGPWAALSYIRERERTYPTTTQLSSESSLSEKATHKIQNGAEVKNESGKKQNVYVLEGGFVQWQEKYGKDNSLTEKYDEDVWRFGN